MRFKNLDLIIAMFIVGLNVAWTQIPNSLMIVGIVLALPLVLFLPGYALIQTLFRRRLPEQLTVSGMVARPQNLKIGHPIGSADQLVLSLGLSMAIDVLMGFGLNLLPIGLNALSWVLSLGLIITVFAVLAMFLRRKDLPRVAQTQQARITFKDCLLFGLAMLVVTSAVWLAIIRPLNPQPSFSQFWILPANQADKTCAVTAGLQSFETASVTYRVLITVNNTQTNTWSSIVLASQQKWIQLVAITPDASGSLYVEAQLYRTDQPNTVYREVHLTFHVSSINENGSVQQRCVLV